jgi:hypothetical protein
VSEWVSDYCLTPSGQFYSDILWREQGIFNKMKTSYIQWDDVHFVLD